MTIQLKHLGDSAYTLVFSEQRTATVTAKVAAAAHAVTAAITAGELPGVIEAVPTFCALTVHINPLQTPENTVEQLIKIASSASPHSQTKRLWRLPVCVENDFAPDLHDVAHAAGLSPKKVLETLWDTRFSVGMLGFMPGFPYMEGWPAAYALPRLKTPRIAVAPGSVAIAGTQCAIYPWQSPGGWRLLGRTPVVLFDSANDKDPAFLAPGDQVYFTCIDRPTFDELKAYPQPREYWQVKEDDACRYRAD